MLALDPRFGLGSNSACPSGVFREGTLRFSKQSFDLVCILNSVSIPDALKGRAGPVFTAMAGLFLTRKPPAEIREH